MLKLIKNGEVYNPEPLGTKDVLITGDRIVRVADNIPVPQQEFCEIEVMNVKGLKVVPGLIDPHVHLIGGGGEDGFKSRTPEIRLTDLTTAGITTAVGCLGTDGTSRHMTSLLAKARGLEEEGITSYIYTGSYQFPLQTITGNCRDDIILIDKVIGIGEIALADHRSSQPTIEQFKRITALSRTGGILSNSAGIVHVHVGNGKDGLGYLLEIAKNTQIPIVQFLPTHINRNPDLLDAANEFIEQGGMVDLTTSSTNNPEDKQVPASKAARTLLDQGASADMITFSSDGMGSLPQFDDAGNFIGLDIGSVKSLLKEMQKAVLDEGIALEKALRFVTINVADILKLEDKGQIKEGCMADLTILDEQLNVDSVLARGQLMVNNGEPIVKGTFED
ncbi:isoaspartyl dipeptidase IadA [Halobacteroides halobius DSM 5150]|uniref:Isoaspartyl dipeptidase n=1 Tax=Halobacteroides halobius (strain ATCC 35273 / DSM 5150 / MD-1) TaxID=748449 RepID=L0KDC9_HALHC|nr:beta-aspartyl-peptidase [Halobacteroides halobius]AGB42369.1 isoaspartyl dipeptidase IadA [Halobacteroides halobius DSM 5150]